MEYKKVVTFNLGKNNKYILKWAEVDQPFELIFKYFVDYLKDEWNCEQIRFFDRHKNELNQRHIKTGKYNNIILGIEDSTEEKWSHLSKQILGRNQVIIEITNNMQIQITTETQQISPIETLGTAKYNFLNERKYHLPRSKTERAISCHVLEEEAKNEKPQRFNSVEIRSAPRMTSPDLSSPFSRFRMELRKSSCESRTSSYSRSEDGKSSTPKFVNKKSFSFNDIEEPTPSTNMQNTRSITKQEVKKHNKLGDIWVIIEDKVYDLTKFTENHPGGIQFILKVAGKDATKLIAKNHNNLNVDFYIKNNFLGDLSQEK